MLPEVLSSERLLEALSVAILLAPTLALVGLGLWGLFGRAPGERVVKTAVSVAQITSLTAALALGGLMLASGRGPLEVNLGNWFEVHGHAFALTFWLDALSVPMVILVALISAGIGRFSANYMHREAGFFRFFLMLLAFTTGMMTIVMSGSFDHLFVGWELVGLTSVLLVAFFWDRARAVDGGLRVLITYRICDVGLLFAAVLLHDFLHTSEYTKLFGAHSWPTGVMPLEGTRATLVGLLLAFAVIGKSALFPLGHWLPRAMEGPSPSSALFYGGLSVHAGVYLVLRAAPIFEASLIASGTLVGLGAITAIQGALVGRTSTDAKTSLAYATMTQLGLIFVAAGCGLWKWAFIHMMGHAMLRTFQLLRAGSALADAQQIRAGLAGRGIIHPRSATSLDTFDWLWRLAFQRFYVDTALARWFVFPVLALSRFLGRFEEKWVELLSGWMQSDISPAPSNKRVIRTVHHAKSSAATSRPTDR